MISSSRESVARVLPHRGKAATTSWPNLYAVLCLNLNFSCVCSVAITAPCARVRVRPLSTTTLCHHHPSTTHSTFRLHRPPSPLSFFIISLSSQCDTTTTDSHPLPNGRMALTVHIPPRGVRNASERPSATKLVLYSSSYFGHQCSSCLVPSFIASPFIASSSNPLRTN